MDKRFVELSPQEKVEFFVTCQRLLVAHHPNSQFVVRKDNVQTNLHYIKTFLANYKGCVYQDDNVCVLYNYLYLTNVGEPELDVRARMYQEPAEHYNAMMVDFVVFRELKDCLAFARLKHDPKLSYALFARHNAIKVYKILDLMRGIFKVPVI